MFPFTRKNILAEIHHIIKMNGSLKKHVMNRVNSVINQLRMTVRRMRKVRFYWTQVSIWIHKPSWASSMFRMPFCKNCFTKSFSVSYHYNPCNFWKWTAFNIGSLVPHRLSAVIISKNAWCTSGAYSGFGRKRASHFGVPWPLKGTAAPLCFSLGTLLMLTSALVCNVIYSDFFQFKTTFELIDYTKRS